MSLHMTFQRCPKPRISCTQCKQLITPDDLCISKSSKKSFIYYHLSCYEPSEYQPIHLSYVRMYQDICEDKEVAKQWVCNWNKRFIVTEESLPQQFKGKYVHSENPPNRRLLLEVYAYFTCKEVELNIALVCRDWFHVTRDNEMWKTRLLLDFHAYRVSETDCPRTQYIANTKRCCWLCHTPVSAETIFIQCPLHHQPYCTACASTNKGRIVTLNHYFRVMKISPVLSKRLNFPYFIYNTFKQNYISVLGNTILPYAQKRKQALLATLTSRLNADVSLSVIHETESCDLEYEYTTERYWEPRNSRFLQVYCGLAEDRGDKEQNVRDYITMVTQYPANSD